MCFANQAGQKYCFNNYRLILWIFYTIRGALKKVHNKQCSSEQKSFLLSDLPGIDVSAHIPWRDLQVEYRLRVERKQNKLPP